MNSHIMNYIILVYNINATYNLSNNVENYSLSIRTTNLKTIKA